MPVEAAHAFYLGYEFAKAVTALTLGKNYVQDQALCWGFLTLPEKSGHVNIGHALDFRRHMVARPMIRPIIKHQDQEQHDHADGNDQHAERHEYAHALW